MIFFLYLGSKMDRQEIISKFEEIKKIDSISLRTIWREAVSIVDNLKDMISQDLHERLKVELQCVYYEIIYGGNENDRKIVRDDFISVVDEVIAELS